MDNISLSIELVKLEIRPLSSKHFIKTWVFKVGFKLVSKDEKHINFSSSLKLKQGGKKAKKKLKSNN